MPDRETGWNSVTVTLQKYTSKQKFKRQIDETFIHIIEGPFFPLYQYFQNIYIQQRRKSSSVIYTGKKKKWDTSEHSD